METGKLTMMLYCGTALAVYGCAAPSPAWISTVPGSQHEICAIGISGPTYYAEDARANSKAAATAELARAVEVKVTSQLRMETSGNSTSADTAMHERAGFDSEVVLKRMQVLAQWVNPGRDERFGAPGTVYTLVCLPMGRQ